MINLYSASTHETEVSWRETVTGNFWRSRHALLGLLFNLISTVSFVHVEINLRQGAVDNSFMLVAATTFFALLAVINTFAWRLRKQTAAALAIVPEGSKQAIAILNTSYLGFRLYLLSLLVFVVCLGGMSMLHLS